MVRRSRSAPSAVVGDLFASESSEPASSASRLQTWPPAMAGLQPGWQTVLETFWASSVGQSLDAFVRQRLAAGATVYPSQPLWALSLTPLSQVRVVILGQDPYHGPGQAQGLSFSVPPGVRVPPSLRNIFKERARDLGLAAPASGSLQAWAERGVLLLNTSLTVEEGAPASHAGRGWEVLTDALLDAVLETTPVCVFLLWGAHAQAKRDRIVSVAQAHDCEVLLLEANHPSPLSATRGPHPFIGCNHFSMAQRWLAQRGVGLDWSL